MLYRSSVPASWFAWVFCAAVMTSCVLPLKWIASSNADPLVIAVFAAEHDPAPATMLSFAASSCAASPKAGSLADLAQVSTLDLLRIRTAAWQPGAWFGSSTLPCRTRVPNVIPFGSLAARVRSRIGACLPPEVLHEDQFFQ